MIDVISIIILVFEVALTVYVYINYKKYQAEEENLKLRDGDTIQLYTQTYYDEQNKISANQLFVACSDPKTQLTTSLTDCDNNQNCANWKINVVDGGELKNGSVITLTSLAKFESCTNKQLTAYCSGNIGSGYIKDVLLTNETTCSKTRCSKWQIKLDSNRSDEYIKDKDVIQLISYANDCNSNQYVLYKDTDNIMKLNNCNNDSSCPDNSSSAWLIHKI
jgi:hypothetical protein